MSSQPPTAATINQRARTGTLAQKIAARLAQELHDAPRWHPSTPRDIAARLEVSGTTASEAKRLLAEHGVITKQAACTTWPETEKQWRDGRIVGDHQYRAC